MFPNRVHHGFGFITSTETNLSKWEPKPLNELAKEIKLPNSTLTKEFENSGGCNPRVIKCNVGIRLERKDKENEKRRGPDVIDFVRKWVQSRESELLGTTTSQIAVPVICRDKAIRYARTQGCYMGCYSGYAIQVEVLPDEGRVSLSSERVSDRKIKYYKWSLRKKNKNEKIAAIDGIRFEYHVFKDFYNARKDGDEKSFEFFCLTSFDWISPTDKVVYRFFCIGEVDGVQEIEKGTGNLCAVEVKSFTAAAKNWKSFYNYRLKEYYAKCVVSQIPRLIVGMKSHWTKEQANYNEILEYNLNGFSEMENAEQEKNLGKAVQIFHKNINLITTQRENGAKFLNGYVGRTILLEVKFESQARLL